MAKQATYNSSRKLLVSEVLRKVSNAKTKAEKIKILRENNSSALRQILIINFDDSVVSLMPEGDVPYTPNDAPAGTDHTRLEHESKGLYRFFKGGAKLPSLRRESMFVQLLEGLCAEEAELLCLVKDGSLSKKYKRITKAVVSEAFPSIQWGGRS